MPEDLLIRDLGQVDYQETWQAMRRFSDERQADSPDELWLLEHNAVFTQGQAGKAEHVLMPGDIPIVKTDRGGQVTYHGPGQLVAYPLLNIKRLKLSVRCLVNRLEEIIIQLLADWQLESTRRENAPGVYLNDAKIAALGLRIRKGCSYHGLSLNVEMDLSPFSRINPCGFTDLRVTQLADVKNNIKMAEVKKRFVTKFCHILGYQN